MNNEELKTECDRLRDILKSSGLSFAICAAFKHEEITRSKARELHGFKSIQEFNDVYKAFMDKK